MKWVALFLLVLALVLWLERFYWKRRAELLELRLSGEKREISSFFDAWLEGRIESGLQKKQRTGKTA